MRLFWERKVGEETPLCPSDIRNHKLITQQCHKFWTAWFLSLGKASVLQFSGWLDNLCA